MRCISVIICQPYNVPTFERITNFHIFVKLWKISLSLYVYNIKALNRIWTDTVSRSQPSKDPLKNTIYCISFGAAQNVILITSLLILTKSLTFRAQLVLFSRNLLILKLFT